MSNLPLHPSLPARPAAAMPRPPPPPGQGGAGAYGSALHASISLPSRVPPFAAAGSHAPANVPLSPAHPPPAPLRPPMSPRTSAGPLAGTRGLSAQASSASDAAALPWPAVRPRLRADQLKVNAQLVELGEGWTVQYRAWKAPALVLDPPNPGQEGAVVGRDLLDYDPLQPFVPSPAGAAGLARSASAQGKSAAADKDDGSSAAPAKKAKKASAGSLSSSSARPHNAFDELLADELSVSAASGAPSLTTPLASPALNPPAPAPAPKGRVPAALQKAQAAASAAASSSAAPPKADAASARPASPPPPPSSAAAPLDPSSSSSPHSGYSSETAQLRARLSALHSSLATDPLGAARAALERDASSGGADRLGRVVWVEERKVWLGGGARGRKSRTGKAKGKEREVAEEKRKKEDEGEGESTKEEAEAVEAHGRVLWVFSVVRGGDADGNVEMADGANGLDAYAFEGLEPLVSGDFSHALLFPAHYGIKSDPSSYISPLSAPARSYPSALALSDSLLSIPLIGQPAPAQTSLQAAYEAFRSAIANVLLDELVKQPVPETRRFRLGNDVLYLPSPRTSRRAHFPALAAPPAIRISLRPLTLNRSSILITSSLEELALSPLPPSSSTASISLAGHAVLLAPLDTPATFLRPLDALTSSQRAALVEEWASHLARAGLDGALAGDFVLCALATPDDETADDPVEVVWPAELVVLDGTRMRASPEQPSSSTPSAPAESGANREPGVVADEAAPPPPSQQHQQPRRRSSVSLAAKGALAARVPHDSAMRKRLARQVLQQSRRTVRGRPRSDSATSAPGEGELAGESVEGLKDPMKRRTGTVWRWMGEEEKRREEEKENAAAAAAAKPSEAASATSKDDDEKGEAAPPAPAPAAAPINMRTPMSLGASSTEAPSPAELFGMQPAAQAQQLAPSSSAAAHDQPLDALAGMDLDFGLGMYPSPAEPVPAPAAVAPIPASSAPMNSLEAAFSEYDWSDSAFGGGGPGGNGGVSSAFDDNLMLGLTDDDFSFFDAPTPAAAGQAGGALALALPPSLAPVADELNFSAMPATSSIDTAFDLFSSAPDALPMTTAASSSAFPANAALASSTSPHFAEQGSPALPFHFGAFDPLTPNALGLAAASPPAPTPHAHPPQTPFSPVVLPLSAHTPASIAATPHPASFTPGVLPETPLQPSPTPLSSFVRGLAAFEPISFAPLHSAADDKYDPRKGKFGLPSPDSDQEGHVRSLIEREDVRPDFSAWYKAVCDPRIALAERLRRQHLAVPTRPALSGKFRPLASPATGASAKSITAPAKRAWSRRRLGLPAQVALAHFEVATPSTVQHTFDEGESEPSSSSDDEGTVRSAKPDAGGDRIEEAEDGSPGGGEESVLGGSYGPELLAGAMFLQRDSSVLAPPVLPAPPIDAGNPEISRDLVYHVVTEHLMYQRDFRDATLALARPAQQAEQAISAHAISTVSSTLSAVCTALSPSPLFADHTSLAPLTAESTPAFLLRSQQCLVRTSRTAIDFWRPMGFEPVPGAKDVTAFVLYEDAGTEAHDLVKDWLKSVGAVYEGMRFGMHSAGTLAATSNFGGVQDGLIPVSAGLLAAGVPRNELRVLLAALVEAAKVLHNVVVYVAVPLGDSPLSPTSPLGSLLHHFTKARAAVGAANLLTCAIPPTTLTRSGRAVADGDGPGSLARVAVSIYDQLQVPVERLRIPTPETFPSARPMSLAHLGHALRLFQAPVLTVAPPPTRKVQFALNWPASSLEVEHRHRFLQVCYGSQRLGADGAQEWLVVASMDETGETWRIMPRLIKVPPTTVADVQRARIVWQYVKTLIDAADIEWRVVLCKLGEPSAIEAKTWDSLLKDNVAPQRRAVHVTFASIELNPALSLTPADLMECRPSTASSISEEGELGAVKDGSASLFDDSLSTFAFTPAEPVSLASLPVTPAASTFLFHAPRLSSFKHARTAADALFDSEAVSAYAVHFFVSHASRTSAYTGTLGGLVADVRRNFVEHAALAQARCGMSGRLSWHVEATALALSVAHQLG
ncbi:uncharacterized protein JCM10292_006995 [Rhodotorula paludigena]|uniref:uncharacterized protein n=1 Tax=Rhodotorula paludigena TaxID=86838 RepID=UPI0031710D40